MEYTEKQPGRIVVKIGTNLLDSAEECFNHDVIWDLSSCLSRQLKQGREIILVSSGAVGAGRRALGEDRPPTETSERQALAAIGQPLLMNLYSEVFAKRGITVAQVLLTRPGLDQRERYLNARQTLEHLLSRGVLPIVNENDTVVTEELDFGDNDRLAAAVAGKVHADLLVLLTDVDYVWDQEGKPIKTSVGISDEVLSSAGGPASDRSRGGMRSKLTAVQEGLMMGVTCVVAPGRKPGVVDELITGYSVLEATDMSSPTDLPGSWFFPPNRKLASRKRWILTRDASRGTIVVDRGARQALETGDRSLLPSGVVEVRGDFSAGDVVSVICQDNRLLAKGLANLSAAELRQCRGLQTSEIGDAIERKVRSKVAIHIDDLVLLTTRSESALPDTTPPVEALS